MTQTHHKSSAIIRAANAALFVDRDLDAIERYFAPDYVVHFTEGRSAEGHVMIRRTLQAILNAFAPVDVQVEVLMECDQRVAWHRTLRATQTGAFKGFPASGKTLVWRDMVVSECREGRIAQEWVVTDLAERLLLARKK